MIGPFSPNFTYSCTPQSLEPASRGCKQPCPSSEKGRTSPSLKPSARPVRAQATARARCLEIRAPAPISQPAGRLARLKALASNSSELVYGSGTAVRHAGFIAAMTAARTPERCLSRDSLSAALSEASTSMLRAEAVAHGFNLQESAGTIIASPEPDAASPATLEDIAAIEPSLYAACDVKRFSFSRATTWSVSYYAKQLRDHLTDAGVKILCGRKASGLLSDKGRICGVAANDPVRADAVVVACGTAPSKFFPSTPTAACLWHPSPARFSTQASRRRLRHASCRENTRRPHRRAA